MAKRFIYTNKMLGFLREHFPANFACDLTVLFNAEFGTNQTHSAIRACLKNNSIKCGVRRSKAPRLYTEEHLAWIKIGYKKYDLAELTKNFNSTFNMNVSVVSMRACTRNHKIKSGRTGFFTEGQVAWNKGMKGLQTGGDAGWFKKGNIPVNHKDVGSQRVTVDGYIEVKIDEPNVWDLMHRKVWREHHGPIGSGDLIKFKNNNKQDCRIENLFLSSLSENAIMNGLGYNELKGDLKDTAINIVRLKSKTKEVSV